MSLVLNEYTGDGVTTTFNFSMVGGYLSRDFVVFLTRPNDKLLEYSPYTGTVTWLSDFSVRVSDPIPSGTTFVITRRTDAAALVDFQNTSRITERNLDTAFGQSLHRTAELEDVTARRAEASSILAEEAVAAAKDAAESAEESATYAATAASLVAAANAAAGASAAFAQEAASQAEAATDTADEALALIQQAVKGNVDSFNGRDGAVLPQQGDYTPDMVGFNADGVLTPSAGFSTVPAWSDPVLNTQAQALANRTEIIKSAVLSYHDYADILDASPRLAVGQIVESLYDQMRYTIDDDHQPSDERPIGKENDYSKIRSYTGRATRLKVIDNTGAHWWVRRGSAADNGGTVLVDALGRSWERESAGEIMVSWFQTVGDGIADDTNPLQAAITYATDSGRELRGEPGAVYRVTSGLTANGALRFDMCNSTIDGSDIPVGTGYNQMFVLKVTGSIDVGISVTANVVESATSISLTSTSGLSAEDYVLLSSQQTMVDGYGNSANKRGELGRIKTVTSGTAVELVDATLFSYASASPTIIQKINPLFGVSLKNGTIIAGGANSRHTTLQLFYCVNPVIEDVNITGGDDVGIATFFCYGGSIKGGRIRDSMWQEPGDPETAGGTGYGVCLYSATRDFVVEGVHFENCIRAITGGGAYPSVHCLTKFCVAEDVKNGFGGHEPCWWWTVEDCIVRRASGVGVNCRGQFTKVHRCKFFDTSGFGIQVRTFYTNPLGVRGTELVDNEFVRSGGILLDGDATHGRVVNTTIRGGRFEYTNFNNIAIRRSDNVLIDGVQLVSQRVVTANDGQAISISGSATSGDQCTDVVIANCQVVNAARRGVSATRVQRLTITGNNVMYALNDGIYLEQCVDTNISGNRVRGGDVAFSAPIRAVNSLRTTVTGNNVAGKNDTSLTSNHGIVFSASGGLDCLDNVAVGNTISGAASAVIAVSGGGGTINHTVVVGNNGRGCYGATKFNVVSANKSVDNNLS